MLEYSLFGSAEKEIEFFVHFAAKTFSIMTLSTLCHYHVVVCEMKKRKKVINDLMIATECGESNFFIQFTKWL